MTPDEQMKQAEAKAAAGDVDGAIELLKQAAATDTTGEASLRLGRAAGGQVRAGRGHGRLPGRGGEDPGTRQGRGAGKAFRAAGHARDDRGSSRLRAGGRRGRSRRGLADDRALPAAGPRRQGRRGGGPGAEGGGGGRRDPGGDRARLRPGGQGRPRRGRGHVSRGARQGSGVGVGRRSAWHACCARRAAPRKLSRCCRRPSRPPRARSRPTRSRRFPRSRWDALRKRSGTRARPRPWPRRIRRRRPSPWR